MNVLWAEHRWEAIKHYAEQGALVVAPFGSTEQHGPMLPLDTDIHIAERKARSGAELAWERYRIPVLVLPTMPVGLAPHHMHFAGTLTFEPETYVSLAAEILTCVVQHGFRKIAVFSGHGGNFPGLKLAIGKVVYQFREKMSLRIALMEADPLFKKLMTQIRQEMPDEGQPGIHASIAETSETLNDRPHLVRRERMVRPTMKRTTVPEWRWQTHELTETGAFGDPSLAQPEFGEKIWNAWAESAAQFIKRLWEDPL